MGNCVTITRAMVEEAVREVLKAQYGKQMIPKGLFKESVNKLMLDVKSGDAVKMMAELEEGK